ncbi:hypothetical protein AQ749_12080 [Burkholderia pseudomallei]|nr:hypothetical protein AQ710_09380 [Burkholderia pseudomallei]OMQ61201.1 hypothetical protein AQ709_19285 [Burkholderia pseudomallei]OMQ87065.1 hypothetical protein AQ715_05420 [Burkholderia pseudomallei]OMQ97396.1 hypothetical protein AQ716_17750 [Burkholderia pseudomallei]OMR03949.1 hypothetical protein AQ719_10335 [Burkholderia pseudomallei]
MEKEGAAAAAVATRNGAGMRARKRVRSFGEAAVGAGRPTGRAWGNETGEVKGQRKAAARRAPETNGDAAAQRSMPRLCAGAQAASRASAAAVGRSSARRART